MSTLIEKYSWKKAVLIGFGLWIFAFIFALAVMGALGIDPQDEDKDFGIDHEDYWTFEAIITPVFIVISLAVLYWYFNSSEIDSEYWVSEAVLAGVTIMIIQFVLDTVFLVILFEGGLSYFVALVTVSYLLIPVWSLLVGYFVRVYCSQA